MAPQTPASGPGEATATADIAAPSLAGGFSLGRGYRLGKLLGEGGMGAVYEATAPDGQRLALKLIRGDHQPDARSRFAREVKAMIGVSSPHVVRVFDADAGGEGGLPFFAMELLAGRDLATQLREHGPLDPPRAARIFAQACRGLAAIHATGLVHRDIKPSNLFLHDDNGRICLKICDFGIAKKLASDSISTDLTRSGGLIGSPHYMSPEQLQDARRVGFQSDLWSLSMAMYEALSGQKGWSGCASVSEVLVAVCTRELPRLQERAPWVPGELAAVVHRNLRRDPSERFESAAAMADALEPLASPAEALADLSSLALPEGARALVAPAPPEPRATPGPARRRVMLVGAVGVGLAALLAGGYASRERPSRPAEPPSGQLRVPAAASVWVQGKPGLNAGGLVTLSAPPGEPLTVSLEHLGVRVEKIVTLTSRGQVVPDEISLEPAPLAAPQTATSSAAPAASQPAASASPRGPRGGPRASASPSAAAPAPVSSSALQLDKKW